MLLPLASQPGIQRDGTVLASRAHTDAQWVRWQRGLPRKMGGYRVVQPYCNGIYRFIISQAQGSASGQLRYLNAGHQSGMDTFTIDNFAQASNVFKPTFPATTNPTTAGVNTGAVCDWQMDTQFDNLSGNTLLLIHANNNLLDPTRSDNFPVYSMNVYNPAAGIVQVPGYGTGSDGHGGTQQALFPNGISGGLVSLAPYMIVYGNNGFFAWSSPGYPTDFVGTSQGSLYVGATQITNQKIIRGLPLRAGGGYSPAGLFWSVDSLVRANFVGITNGTWQFDQLTCQSSILSDAAVIEHDGTFYWAGVDRFLMFNGVVQEIPNSQNLNYFYDGINTTYAGKSYCFKVPRYGEIWWCYPRGSNTECSHAVVYNYREKYWYDTPLLNSQGTSMGRSFGLHTDALIGPLMGGISPFSNLANAGTYYNLWMHETGTDELNGTYQNAIDSYYTTAPITNLANPQQPSNATLSLEKLIPDFVQTGDLTVTVLKQNNARSPVLTGSVVTVKDPATVQTSNQLNQIVPLKDTAQILRLKVESNVIGGNFQAGASMLDVSVDGQRDT
jgi:hypothetical protein